jgi:hypothetical protein
MQDLGSTDLSVASLKAEMEETTNAILGTSWRVVQDKAKTMTE